MYRIVYGIFYLLSLLPWKVIYFLSDCIYGLIYYVIGYRKDVVMNNLSIAFPEKTEAEKIRIAKDFYRNFTDSFIEIIKLISINEKEFRKRISSNIEVVNDLPASVPNVSLVAAHYFNWEFANLAVSLESRFKTIAVYMPVTNKVFDKLIYKLRSKFGTILIPATEFRHHFPQYTSWNYLLGLVADQNPGNISNAFWTPFFGKMTPFVKGPERTSKTNNSAVVYIHFYKVKRGHYRMQYQLITTDPKSYATGELTKEIIRITEDAIRKEPANYLWSHRRWKHQFNEEQFGHLVI